MKDKWKKKMREWFPVSKHDSAVSIGVLLAAVCFCVVLLNLDSTGGYASMVFVLAVVCIARLTTGYFYSVVASFVGVVCTNYIFTYPYLSLNFTIAGYPLTFMAMLAVSIITSALTTQLRDHERLRAETEKEKMRANLLRAISHDIRTPLTSIVGSVSALREDGSKIPEETKEELLAHVQEEAQWLITMVENLLSITRINNEGAASISRQPEVLEEVVGGAVQKFRGRHKNVRVTVDFPREIAVVSMDAILIEQVMINLLENAVVHGKGTTEIRISFVQDEETVAIVLLDDGGGVDPAILPHLLDDSYAKIRAQHSDTRRNMGIGLSVCRSILAAHDGGISVCNAEGGAEFSVVLPLAREENEEVDEIV